jgi:DNA polymerase III subunit delta'
VLNLVQGQDEGVRFLRLVVEGKFVSPLLLVGPSGTGKRFAVLQGVREMFCQGTKDDSCSCESCYQLGKDIHADLRVLQAGDSDIGVDEIRKVTDISGELPYAAPYRVFVIDGADRMTLSAANALLKTLESPPASVRFFLLAESYGRVIPTIRSRCGLVSFRPLPEAYILAEIQRFETDDAKALVYSRLGEGSVGRAVQFWGSGRLSLRDKVLSILRSARNKDLPGVFLSLGELEKDLPLALNLIDLLLHDVTVLEYDASRVVNTDLVGALKELKTGVPLDAWDRLRCSLRDALTKYQRVKINLPFHVKSIFAEHFFAG